MVTFAAIMVFMLENQTNRSDYRKMNESTNELNDLKLKPAVKFVCLLWYVKHLLIWSLISNIYKFILIYIIMIVFSCAKSLLVSLRSMYWLPGLLQMFRHLGELGRVSTWGGRKNEQEGRCLSQVKWYHRDASVLQGGVCCVWQLLGLSWARVSVAGGEGEQPGALSPACSLRTGMSFLAGTEEWEGHRATPAWVWPLAGIRAGGDQTCVRLVSSGCSAVHLCRLLVFVLRGLFLQGFQK